MEAIRNPGVDGGVVLRAVLLGVSAFDNQGEFPPGILFEACREFRGGATNQLFVNLGEFPGDRDPALLEERAQIPEKIGDPPGRFKEHLGFVALGDGIQELAPAFSAPGHEPKKAKTVGAEATQTEGRERRAGARGDMNRQSGIPGGGDKPGAGVADDRCSRIAHEGEGLPLLQHGDGRIPGRVLAVCMVGAKRTRDAMALEQDLGAPGVFGENEISGLENLQGPEGDVIEVADGGGDDPQAGIDLGRRKVFFGHAS